MFSSDSSSVESVGDYGYLKKNFFFLQIDSEYSWSMLTGNKKNKIICHNVIFSKMRKKDSQEFKKLL